MPDDPAPKLDNGSSSSMDISSPRASGATKALHNFVSLAHQIMDDDGSPPLDCMRSGQMGALDVAPREGSSCD